MILSRHPHTGISDTEICAHSVQKPEPWLVGPSSIPPQNLVRWVMLIIRNPRHPERAGRPLLCCRNHPFPGLKAPEGQGCPAWLLMVPKLVSSGPFLQTFPERFPPAVTGPPSLLKVLVQGPPLSHCTSFPNTLFELLCSDTPSLQSIFLSLLYSPHQHAWCLTAICFLAPLQAFCS